MVFGLLRNGEMRAGDGEREERGGERRREEERGREGREGRDQPSFFCRRVGPSPLPPGKGMVILGARRAGEREGEKGARVREGTGRG